MVELNYRRSNDGFTPLQISEPPRKNKFVAGFSLLEAVIAIAVLSVGIISVLEALSFSARSTGLASDMVNAVFLAEDKMQELEFSPKISPLTATEAEGRKDKFTWSYSLNLDSDLKLYQLQFNTEWQRANRQEELALATYLRE